MAIKIQNTTVINDSRGLENITNLKTINSESILGTGDITIASGTSAITIDNKTGAYTVVAGDLGKIINCTSGTFSVSLTAAATLGSGFNCWIWNTSNTSTDAITIDPNGSETIDGLTTIILRRGEGTQIVCDGTNWQIGDKKTMRGYAENINSVENRPSATGSGSIVIGDSGQASGERALCIVPGGGSATGNYSVALGRNSSNGGSQAITGAGAMALGGSYASGTDSFAAAVSNNTSSYGATGTNSIAIGDLAKAAATAAVAIGSDWGFGGPTADASGAFAIGSGVSASASRSFAMGIAAQSSTVGRYSWSNGRFSGVGDSQHGLFVLRGSTTTTTPVVLTTDGFSASFDNQVCVLSNSAYAFHGTIVARQKASEGTASAAWKIEGLIRREVFSSSTALINSAITVLDNTPGWTIALTGNTSNGTLTITVTGAAATNIRWVATINTSEVIYA